MATADELLANLPPKQGYQSAYDLLSKLPPKGSGPSNAGLYDIGQKVQSGVDAVTGPLNRASNTVARGASNLMFGSEKPVDAIQYGLAKANQGIQAFGEGVTGGTGYLAQRLANKTGASGQSMAPSDYSAATAGTALTLIPYLLGEGEGIPDKRVLVPKASAETAEGVAAAAKHGIPLTRAEVTGSRPAAMGEVGLRSTVTGAIPFEGFDKTQAGRMSSAEDAIRRSHGTLEPPTATGMDAKAGLASEMTGNKAQAEKLYRQIPDLPIESPAIKEHLNMSMMDADSLGDPKVSKALGKARNLIERPAVATEETSPKLGSQYSIGPKTPQKNGPPTFQELNKLRNDLAYDLRQETKWTPFGPEISPSGRKILALKDSVEKDIGDFAQTSLGKYSEFGSAYQKAKGFYGDYAELKKNKLVQKIGKVPESDVASVVFGKGRAEDIRVAKSALGEDGFKAIQDQYFSSLLDEKNIGNKLEKLGKGNSDFLQESLRPEQLQALKEVDAFRRTARGPDRMAGNTSRTAQTGATIGTGALLYKTLKGAFTNPIEAIVHTAEILGLPYAASKLYLGTGSGITLPTRMASKAAMPAALLGQRQAKYSNQQ